MGTVSPSKYMSLSKLKDISINWFTSKGGKEYDEGEVNDLNNIKTQVLPDIPEIDLVSCMSDSELDNAIIVATIFQDNCHCDLITEKALRMGHYDFDIIRSC